MITLNIDAKLVRAAMANQAKKDVRYYLCGILLTTKGDIVGTDGHTCFAGKHSWKDCDNLPRDIILHIDGTIPLSASTVTFELENIVSSELGNTSVMPTKGIVKTNNGKIFNCSEIDGKYPDFNRVLPTRLSDSYHNFIALDATLLARIEKTFGKNAPVAIYNRGKDNAIRVECPSFDALMVIMPLRLGSKAGFPDESDCLTLVDAGSIASKAA